MNGHFYLVPNCSARNTSPDCGFASFDLFKWWTPYTTLLYTISKCFLNKSFGQLGLKIRFLNGCIWVIFALHFRNGDKGSILFEVGRNSFNVHDSVFMPSILSLMLSQILVSSSPSERFSGAWVVIELMSSVKVFFGGISTLSLWWGSKNIWLKVIDYGF